MNFKKIADTSFKLLEIKDRVNVTIKNCCNAVVINLNQYIDIST